MNCYIFDVHINSCFVADSRIEDGILFYTHDLVQVGPLNMIRSEIMSAVKQEVRLISSYIVPVNWWTDFSTWQDFRGLLRTGTELAIHKVVEKFNSNLETFEGIEAYVENIDENGNIEIEITENNEYILQSFTVKASRKRLKRLKEVAAYNVGQCLDCENDAEFLNLPKTLEVLVKKFVNTYSGDYITDSCET